MEGFEWICDVFPRELFKDDADYAGILFSVDSLVKSLAKAKAELEEMNELVEVGLNTIVNEHSTDNSKLNGKRKQASETGQQILDLYDFKRDLRVTPLSRIFAILILNVSQRLPLVAFQELLVFLTLLAKALNEHGQTLGISSPVEQKEASKQHVWSQVEGSGTFDATTCPPSEGNCDVTTMSLNCAVASQPSLRRSKRRIKIAEANDPPIIQVNENQQPQQPIVNNSCNNATELQQQQEQQLQLQLQVSQVSYTSSYPQPPINFCDINCAENISLFSNDFITTYLPAYLESSLSIIASSSSSEGLSTKLINKSVEGIASACHLLKLVVDWMHVHDFTASYVYLNTEADQNMQQQLPSESTQSKNPEVVIEARDDDDIEEYLGRNYDEGFAARKAFEDLLSGRTSSSTSTTTGPSIDGLFLGRHFDASQQMKYMQNQQLISLHPQLVSLPFTSNSYYKKSSESQQQFEQSQLQLQQQQQQNYQAQLLQQQHSGAFYASPPSISALLQYNQNFLQQQFEGQQAVVAAVAAGFNQKCFTPTRSATQMQWYPHIGSSSNISQQAAAAAAVAMYSHQQMPQNLSHY